jgi:hypothetical protein
MRAEEGIADSAPGVGKFTRVGNTVGNRGWVTDAEVLVGLPRRIDSESCAVSSTPDASRGRIVQRKTHTELLEMQGLYAELHQRQLSVPARMN